MVTFFWRCLWGHFSAIIPKKTEPFLARRPGYRSNAATCWKLWARMIPRGGKPSVLGIPTSEQAWSPQNSSKKGLSAITGFLFLPRVYSVTVLIYWFYAFFFFTENEGHSHARVNTAVKGKVLKSSIISNYIIKFLAWFEYFAIVLMLCSMRTGALAKQTCMKWNVEYQSLNHLGLWLCDCISQPCTSTDLLYLFWISADNIWSFFWLIREYLAWTGLSSRDWNLSVFTASYVCLL